MPTLFSMTICRHGDAIQYIFFFTRDTVNLGRPCCAQRNIPYVAVKFNRSLTNSRPIYIKHCWLSSIHMYHHLLLGQTQVACHTSQVAHQTHTPHVTYPSTLPRKKDAFLKSLGIYTSSATNTGGTPRQQFTVGGII